MLNEFKQERIEFARFHKNAEKQVLPIVRKALNKQIENVVAWVKHNGVENVPVEILIDRGVWRTLYPQMYEQVGMSMARLEYYRQRRLEGNASKASAIEFLKNVWSGKLRDYALSVVNALSVSLDQKTADLIKQALGESGSLEIDRLGRIRFFYDKVKQQIKERSIAISRTETTRSSNLGKDIAARSWIEEQGGEGYKVWLGRIQGERPTHLAANDTIIPFNNLFSVGGHDCMRPGDLQLPPQESIMCRCTMSIMSENRYRAYQKRGRINNGRLSGAS